MGIDANTNKMSWAIVTDGSLEAYGEVYFREVSFNGKLKMARKQLEDILPIFGTLDYIGFEKAVRVNSIDTMIKLAEMFGVVKSTLLDLDAKLVEITPVSWQTHIGNPLLRADAKRELVEKHPELKTKSQRDTFIRKYRKNKTLEYVEKKTGVKMPNDDLGDATGIAFTIYEKMRDLNGED